MREKNIDGVQNKKMDKITNSLKEISRECPAHMISDRCMFTEEDRRAFDIDRDAENADIVAFQKTGDVQIFERIYKNRIPTLRVWARRNGHLLGGEDEMFGELSYSFAKAVKKYDRKRSSFNNCLFIFLLNAIRNLRSGKRAKKRRPFGVGTDSINNFLLSLDYNYKDKDGSGNTLMEMLANSMVSKDDTMGDVHLSETIDILARNEPIIKAFLRKLSNGDTLSDIIKESKMKRGKIRISKNQAKKLEGRRKYKTIVIDLIKDKSDIEEDFSLLDYRIENNAHKLHYTIEMRKTEESDMLIKAVRKMRRERSSLMEKIHGEYIEA